MHVFVRLQYCKSTGLVMVSDVGMRHHRTMMTSSMVHQLAICWMLWMRLATMITWMEHSRLAIALRKLGKHLVACTLLGQLKWLLLNCSSPLPLFSIFTPAHIPTGQVPYPTRNILDFLLELVAVAWCQMLIVCYFTRGNDSHQQWALARSGPHRATRDITD